MIISLIIIIIIIIINIIVIIISFVYYYCGGYQDSTSVADWGPSYKLFILSAYMLYYYGFLFFLLQLIA